jgi:hypothetical protein
MPTIAEYVAACTELHSQNKPEMVSAHLDTHPDGLLSPPVINDNAILVDCHFVTVSVDIPGARRVATGLLAAVTQLPAGQQPADRVDFQTLGRTLGSNETALRLFAVGHALHWWRVAVPADLGVGGPAGDAMALGGFLMLAEVRLPAS